MISMIGELYTPWTDFWDYYQDPKTRGWPLLGDPVPIFTFLACYTYCITTLGPRWMKNRPPFVLKKTMIVYNLVQVIMNAYVVVMGFTHLQEIGEDGWLCVPPDNTDSPFAVKIRRTAYFYFILKLVDLTDTVFMVLRKKQSQVSFLHLYHHIGMCVAGWATMTLLPGGSYVLIFGLINCTVHVVMYSYYLLTIVNPASKSWTWKRRITELQLTQFVLTTLHGISGLLDPTCTFPKWALCIYVPQDIFMFSLFWDFYVKTYLKPRAKATQPKENIEDLKNGKKSE